MNNLVIFPLVIPLLTGILMAIFRHKITLQRWLSLISFALTIFVSFSLLQEVAAEGIQILEMGGWAAPFGIVFVVDMLSVFLLVTTGVVSLICIIYAFNSIGREREKFYFYPLVQFLITGVNGSFLTGDLFNLFVCFEVMLIASYVLLSLGGTKIQFRESIKYVLINTVSSTLFLVAIAYLYAALGTLNMAHLAVRVAEVGQNGFLSTVAILFIIVFSLKAALFLFFWLPGSYSAPPPAIGAIFGALLTKVGIYALIRMFTLIFYHQPGITHTLLGVMAALTMLFGGIGAIAYKDIRYILAYNVIIGVGFIVSGLAIFTPSALMGAIYYLVHDMLMKALLFLLGGTVIRIVATSKLENISGLIRNHPLLGWMFFITAFSLAGVPPLSGFLGKVLIIQGGLARGLESMTFYFLVAIALISSLMVLYSLMKIFMGGFWGETALSREMEKGSTKGLLLPCVLLTLLGVFWGLGSEIFYPWIEQGVETLLHPEIYLKAVLHEVI